jgi:putative spermidine/putrescine transport system permease protein
MSLANRSLNTLGRFAKSRWPQMVGIILMMFFLVFFIIPLGYFLLISFFTYIQSGQYEVALTLENYRRLISDQYYLRILWATFQLGIISAAVCFVVGYPLAYFLGRSRSKWRNLVLGIVVASLFTNLVVRTFGWIVLLSEHGLLNNFLMDSSLLQKPLQLIYNMTGVVIGEAQVELPVFIMLVAGVIQMIDPDLEFAARVMGADNLQAFFAVVWPLSLRGIIGGLSLVFALSISSYITPNFLAGGRIIYASLFISTLVTKTLNYPLAGALSAVLLLSSLGIVGALSWVSKKYL